MLTLDEVALQLGDAIGQWIKATTTTTTAVEHKHVQGKNHRRLNEMFEIKTLAMITSQWFGGHIGILLICYYRNTLESKSSITS